MRLDYDKSYWKEKKNCYITQTFIIVFLHYFHCLQLVNGKADVKITIEELLKIAPIPGRYYSPDPWNMLAHRTLLVAADVNETVTGIIYSGNATVDVKTEKYQLKFLEFSPSNFKPGLLYTAFVSCMALPFLKLCFSHFCHCLLIILGFIFVFYSSLSIACMCLVLSPVFKKKQLHNSTSCKIVLLVSVVVVGLWKIYFMSCCH